MADKKAPEPSTGKSKIMKNPMAEAANWNARCITEDEAPHKWNEAWGQMFGGGIPHEYPDRIAFLKEELKNCPVVAPLPKYGCGPAFGNYGAPNFRVKGKAKTVYSNAELDAYNAANGKGPRTY